ncbi:MAG: hypothetical protein QOJ75_2007 [Chloroflexota bacterium]|nr:hypothetical protein [Chloroflexota bacterium]
MVRFGFGFGHGSFDDVPWVISTLALEVCGAPGPRATGAQVVGASGLRGADAHSASGTDVLCGRPRSGLRPRSPLGDSHYPRDIAEGWDPRPANRVELK